MKLLVRSAFIIILIAAVFAAVFLMLSDSQENSAAEPELTPADSSVQPADTLDDTTADTVEKPVRPQQSLPPGHARIEISITELENGNVTAVIHQVLGYGSSTKPLASGQELSINAATYFKNTSIDTAGLKDQRRMATVSMRQTPAIGEKDGGTEWVLVKLANN